MLLKERLVNSKRVRTSRCGSKEIHPDQRGSLGLDSGPVLFKVQLGCHARLCCRIPNKNPALARQIKGAIGAMAGERIGFGGRDCLAPEGRLEPTFTMFYVASVACYLFYRSSGRQSALNFSAAKREIQRLQ